MKRLVLPLACVGLMALPLTMAAMNNKDVIKMQRVGLSEETILAAMQKEKPEYDVGADALIELKTAGISEKMIQSMIKLQSLSAPAAENPSAAPAVGAGSTGAFWQEFPSIAPATADVSIGNDYFTRYTFREEKNEYKTTNYARGNIVPINTPVKLVSMSGSKMTLRRLDTNKDIKVENEDKFTKKSITEIAAVMLSKEKIPIEKLPEDVATAVRNGDMRKGMTKELVLLARGHPPAHETSSIDNDRWVYWSSRFVKQTIVFVNGRLSEGRGLN